MVNALIAYHTNRRRNSAAAANASSDEIDGVHGEQDLDGKLSFVMHYVVFALLARATLVGLILHRAI